MGVTPGCILIFLGEVLMECLIGSVICKPGIDFCALNKSVALTKFKH